MALMSKPIKQPKLSNPSAARGHTEQRLGACIVCQTCLERMPRGGWEKACRGDNRRFMGES
jgi:hypothetical protein